MDEILPFDMAIWLKAMISVLVLLTIWGCCFCGVAYYMVRKKYFQIFSANNGHALYVQYGNLFDENLLMSIATLGAFRLGESPEAVAVMLFYQIGEYFQDKATSQSRQSIARMMDIRSDKAWRLEGGETVQVDPETVRVADPIIVKPGEKVPLDGQVREGRAILDTSA